MKFILKIILTPFNNFYKLWRSPIVNVIIFVFFYVMLRRILFNKFLVSSTALRDCLLYIISYLLNLITQNMFVLPQLTHFFLTRYESTSERIQSAERIKPYPFLVSNSGHLVLRRPCYLVPTQHRCQWYLVVRSIRIISRYKYLIF